MTKQIKPFGNWTSPLSPEAVAGGARRFGSVVGSGPWIYWSEGRPSEQGRQAIMRAAPAGKAEDMLAPPFSARSRIHEYGGGEFIVDAGVIYFTNDADQDLYVLIPGGTPERLTNEPGMRFADAVRDQNFKRLIAVCERDNAGQPGKPDNLLVTIALAGRSRGKVVDLVTGHDFFAAPCLNPSGTRLAWMAWDLPDMPWDQAALFVADIDDDTGKLGEPQQIAGGGGTSVFQPQWAGDDRLLYVADASGWGNIHVWDGKTAQRLHEAQAEFGRPLWQLGMTSFALGEDGKIIAAFIKDGALRFGTIDPETGELAARETRFAMLDMLAAYDDGVAAIAGRHASPSSIVAIPARDEAPAILRSAAEITLPPGDISKAQITSFANVKGETVYGLYYPPANAAFEGEPGTKPPAIILAHGGPTSSADRGLRLRTQFYTTRGFAVFDIDYAGSTGYGRVYRERLDGNWGIADVADCAAAANHLAGSGLADAKRIAIQGGSAGGYTVLMALATTTVFAAGSCHYGVSDLGLLLAHTHKFESGYLHRLLGTTPDNYQETFAARSPLALIDNITCPVILFQGLDDKVVPPEQSRLIAQKLTAKGVDAPLHEYPEEGHGFRRADTITAVLAAELAFYQRVLGLQAAEG